MSLEKILSADSGRKRRKRVGRGPGSTLGKTCGRGQKGEGARSGGKNRGPGFEGGQFPLWMRLPRRGFSNFAHRRAYQVLPLARILDRIVGDVIDLDVLIAVGLAHAGERIKIVAGIEVSRALTVRVGKVTASVRQAIEAAGGTVEELDG